ncbi:MAG: GAF domain-containing protein, partial [Anaerolineales bacterium]|nr:GAF domain-containing protein [Anaerolineales bacterium]
MLHNLLQRQLAALGLDAHTPPDKENWTQFLAKLNQSLQNQGETPDYKRLAFEEIVISISSIFLNLTSLEVDKGIQEVLQQLGEFMEVDHSYVFLLTEDRQFVSNTHEWCAPNITAKIDKLQNISIEMIPWWMDKMTQLEVIHIPLVADLPSEARLEKESFQAKNIQSLLGVPLVHGRSLIGFLGIDSVHKPHTWNEENIALLKIVGDTIANALMRRRIEEALKQERDFGLQVMNTMGQGLTVIDENARFEFVNAAYAALVGYTPGELIGKTPFDLADDYERKHLKQILTQRKKGEESTYETNLIRADGQAVEVIITGAPRWRNNKVIGTIAVITDLTRQKQVEEELARQASELTVLYRASSQLFRTGSLQESAQLIVDTLTTEFDFADCAVLLLESFVITTKTAVTSNKIIRIATAGKYQHSVANELHLDGAGLIAAAIRSCEPILVSDVRKDPRYLSGDSQTRSELVVPLRAGTELMGALDLQSPQVNAFDDRAVRIINVFAEHASLALENARLHEEAHRYTQELEHRIAERRAVEKQLRQTTSELQAIFQALPDLYFRLSETGVILDYKTADPSNLYVPPKEFLSQRMQDVLPSNIGQQIDHALAEVLETRKLVSISYSLPIAEGEKTFEARLTPLSNKQIVVVVRDITERKQFETALFEAKEAAEAAARAKSEFLANMS